MKDAVSAILEERAGSGPHFSAWVVLSLLLHVLVAAPMIATATRPPSKQVQPVRVRLTSSAVTRPAPSVPSPVATPPVEQPKEVAEPPKPETRQLDRALFGRSPEKPAETPDPAETRAAPSRTPASTPAPPERAAPSIAVGEGASVSSSFDGTFPYPLYVERMLSLIADRWFRPEASPSRAVTVHFVIDRNGRAHEVEVTTSSGNSGFDRAARRAIVDAQPFPPLPFDYIGTDLGVYLEFK